MRLARLMLIVLVVSLLPLAVEGQTKRRPRRRVPPATGHENVISLPSGLIVAITHRAGGVKPSAGQTVSVHYTGTLTNGVKFDSSHDRGEPIAFPIGQGKVIKGWDEGIAQLGVGDRAVLIIPPGLAYGDQAVGDGLIPANSALIFVVELVAVE